MYHHNLDKHLLHFCWIILIHFFLIVPSMAATQSEPIHEVDGKPVAPDFSLIDLDEKVHRLSELRGKVVIINFWATWCPPCRDELPSMEKAYQILQKRGVVMLAINVGEDANTIFTFTSDYPVSFPLLLDKDSAVVQRYPVIGLPTSYIIDTNGHLVFRIVGTRDWTDPKIIEKINSLIR